MPIRRGRRGAVPGGLDGRAQGTLEVVIPRPAKDLLFVRSPTYHSVNASPAALRPRGLAHTLPGGRRSGVAPGEPAAPGTARRRQATARAVGREASLMR